MLHTTFARAKEAGACIHSYKKFAKYKGGIIKWGKDTPFPLSEVLEVCGFKDTLWALRIVIESADKEIREFACDCAERVLPLFEKQYPNDTRPHRAIETARKFANGEATQTELDVAWDAAVGATDAAWAATVGASGAAYDAARRAWLASGSAAIAANTRDATEAAGWGAARDAAWADWADWDAEEEWQKQRFIKLLTSNSRNGR